jgi:hypothetical protein
MLHLTNSIRYLASCLLLGYGSLSATQVIAQEDAQAQIDALKEQVEELNNVAVRTQSHIMIDVEYHFANLWFAAHNQQWDLASFYLRESRSHLAWTVRVRPVRNIRGGGTIDLKPFQDSIEQAGFTPIQAALDAKNISQFENLYTQTLSICHACHTAGGLGYLEPRIPEVPPSALMVH